MSRTRYLVVPGYGDSLHGHWQSYWQRDLGEDAVRLKPGSWSEPEGQDWLAAIGAAMAPGTVIIAHSLGCLAAVSWLRQHPGVAAGALLVALPDPAGPEFPSAVSGFHLSAGPLAERALLVGSRDDPFAGWEFTVRTATDFQIPLVDLGASGHINADSGFGPWPQGRQLLHDLVHGE